MPRTMKLIPFAEFATPEREALLALLARLHLPARQVCVSRVEALAGQGDPAIPTVVLVSAPGWWRAYEQADWIARLEHDLAAAMQPELATAR